MQTIITAATILSMYLSAAENSNSSYYYNADMENGKVTTMYVYEADNQMLTSKLAYNYTYDEQERLVKKEVMRWNSVSGKWENDYSLNLIYTEDGYELSRSVWDKRTQAYLPTTEKAVYQYVTDQVVAVNYLRRHDTQEQFESVDSMLVMNPTEGLLLATR
jgi:hypothetical protein